jgi:hypothetical protein
LDVLKYLTSYTPKVMIRFRCHKSC